VIQQEVWSQNYILGDKSKFAEVISLNGQNILFALKENAIHQHSKPEDSSTESSSSPAHRRQQEQSLSDYA
jgi:hypothetical protein